MSQPFTHLTDVFSDPSMDLLGGVVEQVRNAVGLVQDERHDCGIRDGME